MPYLVTPIAPVAGAVVIFNTQAAVIRHLQGLGHIRPDAGHAKFNLWRHLSRDRAPTWTRPVMSFYGHQVTAVTE